MNALTVLFYIVAREKERERHHADVQIPEQRTTAQVIIQRSGCGQHDGNDSQNEIGFYQLFEPGLYCERMALKIP